MKNVFKNMSLVPKNTQKQLAFPTGKKGLEIGNHMFSGNAQVVDETISEIEIKDGLKICDIGCGPRYSLTKLALKVLSGEIIGIDPSKIMCELARKNNEMAIKSGLVKIVNEKTPTLSFKNNYFDYLLLNNVVYFWKKDELTNHLIELLRVLKVGGHFIIYMTDKKYLELRTGKDDETFNKHSIKFVSEKLNYVGFRKHRIRKVGRKNGEYGWILNFQK